MLNVKRFIGKESKFTFRYLFWGNYWF